MFCLKFRRPFPVRSQLDTVPADADLDRRLSVEEPTLLSPHTIRRLFTAVDRSARALRARDVSLNPTEDYHHRGHCARDLGPLIYASVVRTTVADDHRNVVLSHNSTRDNKPTRRGAHTRDYCYRPSLSVTLSLSYVPCLGCRAFSTKTTRVVPVHGARNGPTILAGLPGTSISRLRLNPSPVSDTAFTGPVTDFFTSQPVRVSRVRPNGVSAHGVWNLLGFFRTGFAVIGQAAGNGL